MLFLLLSQQETGAYPSAAHVPGPGGAMVTQQGGNGMAANHNNGAYLSGLQKQQQQIQMLSPQQKQFLQSQMLVEQVRGLRAHLGLGFKDVLRVTKDFQSSSIVLDYIAVSVPLHKTAPTFIS